LWKASKGSGILPLSYPQPAVQSLQGNPQKVTIACDQIQQTENHSVAQSLMARYPTVFNGQIRGMEEENQHDGGCGTILCQDTKVNPIAYRDKLQAELNLLQEQGIIAPGQLLR